MTDKRKYLYSIASTGDVRQRQSLLMGGGYYGPSVIRLTKNGETDRVLYLGHSDYSDDITEYSFRFGYNDGYPCIFVNFSAINPKLQDGNHMVCLELTENLSNPAAYRSNYIEKTINCLEENGHASPSKEGETWLNLSDLTTGVEYPIYLEAQTARCFQSFLRVKSTRDTSPNWTLYDDWFLHYYVRPLIRTCDTKGMIKSPSRFMRYRPDSIAVEYCIHDELT